MSTRTPEWFLIRDTISASDFVHSCASLYNVLEGNHVSKSNEDPFMKAVLMGNHTMTKEEWDTAEKLRLTQKVMEMKMGDLHEEIAGKIAGYETLPTGHATGVDVQKKDGTVVIELKNRDNTVKGSDGKHLVALLEKHAEEGKTAIFAQMNCPKGKVNRFGASANSKVLFMNGQQLYAFLSGRESFFDDLLRTVAHAFTSFKTLAELKAALGIA
jgi:hypothetical protein